jgi:hypothetical protein
MQEDWRYNVFAVFASLAVGSVLGAFFNHSLVIGLVSAAITGALKLVEMTWGRQVQRKKQDRLERAAKEAEKLREQISYKQGWDECMKKYGLLPDTEKIRAISGELTPIAMEGEKQ